MPTANFVIALIQPKHYNYCSYLISNAIVYKLNIIIEEDEDGFYAYCPELKGCQSQGDTLEEV